MFWWFRERVVQTQGGKYNNERQSVMMAVLELYQRIQCPVDGLVRMSGNRIVVADARIQHRPHSEPRPYRKRCNR